MSLTRSGTWPLPAAFKLKLSNNAVGALGDSISNEYFNRSGIAHNWVEMLAIGGQQLPVPGQLDFGPYTPEGGAENQRDGYDYNWGSVSGGNSWPITYVQAPGLASQIHDGKVNVALVDPKTKARIAGLGATPLVLSPAAFRNLIASETEKWAKVIKFANIKPE